LSSPNKLELSPKMPAGEEEEQRDPMELDEPLSEESDDEEEEEIEEVDLLEDLPIKFRNYNPRDERLQRYKLPRPEVPDIATDINTKLEKLRNGADPASISLAPKKANWDLKRDISKKLELVEKKTQQSLLELIQEKLSKQSNEEDMDE